MSTNIMRLTVEKLRSLRWQFDVLNAFFDSEISVSSSDVDQGNKRWVVFSGVCERGLIRGLLDASDSEWVVMLPDTVDDLDELVMWSGVGSGSRWEDFVDLFRQSAGYIQFSVLWESGEIDRITVTEGEVIVTRVSV